MQPFIFPQLMKLIERGNERTQAIILWEEKRGKSIEQDNLFEKSKSYFTHTHVRARAEKSTRAQTHILKTKFFGRKRQTKEFVNEEWCILYKLDATKLTHIFHWFKISVSLLVLANDFYYHYCQYRHIFPKDD